MAHTANEGRYDSMVYNRCGQSGLMLPAISLGLWHNFGDTSPYDAARDMICGAFDMGITHFDLANNYGPSAGSAEVNFGKILKSELSSHRDEMIISSKAGYYMWPGPYGDLGSKKYIIASIDQSLKRCGLEYFDIFYHHRPDDETPLEESMSALEQIVRSGKALYVGISNYGPEKTRRAYEILRSMGLKCLIHQPKFNMLNRKSVWELLGALRDCGMGCIAFSPLAQGVLTSKYFDSIPKDSRAAGESVFLSPDAITQEKITLARKLDEVARRRGQSLAQMALAWVLFQKPMTSVIIGARTVAQIEENVKTVKNLHFTAEELREIESILETAPFIED